MKNFRRVPFITVSIASGLLLVFISLLYFFQVKERSDFRGVHAVDVLYLLVGLEMLIVEPCLIYYISKS